MTTSSKRAASHKEQQLVQENENEDYDEYVYYPYYPKSLPDGGYEYVQDPQKSEEYEQSSEHYLLKYDFYA
ncbi:unnamed protein product [Rotaria sordida]|uniref:Uncharacterized protein n=1 Tax=Rotaria sordida TaxID=392033 RepID=A0A818RPM6_9BILA|nr:unnamed protein product [Rotaria sordida]CAF3728891.1 unnamed protein product [Rotaria sordida]